MRLMGIAIHSAKRGPMQELRHVLITKENGLEGDFRGKGGADRSRQVTVLCNVRWVRACEEAGVTLPWTARRANLLMDFPEYGPHIIGKLMTFGNPGDIGAVLEITGETEPCERMDEIRPGLKDALKSGWRGGLTCRVVRGGVVRVDSWVTLI